MRSVLNSISASGNYSSWVATLAFGWVVFFPIAATAKCTERGACATLQWVDSAQPVEGVKWTTDDLTVIRENGRSPQSSGGLRGGYVVVEGKFRKPGWKLIVKNEEIQRAPDGSFAIMVPVRAEKTTVEIAAVGPRGAYQKQQFEIVAQEPALKEKELFGGGIATSLISYSDSRTKGFSAFSATGKFHYSFLKLPRDWDLGLTAFFTLLPIQADEESQVRYLGGNVRGGYHFKNALKKPWELWAYSGFYYTSMSVSSEKFGYKNVMGPQLFGKLAYTFRNRQKISGYLKFAPVSSGIIPSFGNRELAAGAIYQIPLQGRHSIGISLDASMLNLSLGGSDENPDPVKISNQSFSLGVSYIF